MTVAAPAVAPAVVALDVPSEADGAVSVSLGFASLMGSLGGDDGPAEPPAVAVKRKSAPGEGASAMAPVSALPPAPMPLPVDAATLAPALCALRAAAGAAPAQSPAMPQPAVAPPVAATPGTSSVISPAIVSRSDEAAPVLSASAGSVAGLADPSKAIGGADIAGAAMMSAPPAEPDVPPDVSTPTDASRGPRRAPNRPPAGAGQRADVTPAPAGDRTPIAYATVASLAGKPPASRPRSRPTSDDGLASPMDRDKARAFPALKNGDPVAVVRSPDRQDGMAPADRIDATALAPTERAAAATSELPSLDRKGATVPPAASTAGTSSDNPSRTAAAAAPTRTGAGPLAADTAGPIVVGAAIVADDPAARPAARRALADVAIVRPAPLAAAAEAGDATPAPQARPRRQTPATAGGDGPPTAAAPTPRDIQAVAPPATPAPLPVARPAAVPVAATARLAATGAERGLAAVRAAAWIDGIARDIAFTSAGDGPARFTVAPASLGPIEVALTRSEGRTDVAITVADANVGAIVADATPRLIEAARANGVEVRHATVAVADTSQAPAADRPPVATVTNMFTGAGYGGGMGTGDGSGHHRPEAPPADGRAARASAPAVAAAAGGARDDGLYA